MGIGSSRKRYGYYNQNKYQQQQKRQFLRRTTSTQSIPVLSLPNNYYPNGSSYPYGGLQLPPPPPPYPSVGYNAYPQQQQQQMMMMPRPLPPRTPVPYYNPSPQQLSPTPQPVMPTPYGQQQVPMQPVYNNMSSPSATPYYSPSTPVYHSSPARLLTDWTGGGKISPGFLGPPI